MSLDPVILHGHPGIGTLVDIDEPRPEFNRTGYDRLTQDYAIMSALSDLPARLDQLLPVGARHPVFPEMWLQDRSRATDGAGDCWLFSTEWLGRLTKRPFLRQLSANVEQSSADNILVTPDPRDGLVYPGTGVRVNALESAPVWTVRYLTAVAPNQEHVSQNFTYLSAVRGALEKGYPQPPKPPKSKWNSIPDPTWSYPAGWVLMERACPDPITDINGREVFFSITDTWQWIHQTRP